MEPGSLGDTRRPGYLHLSSRAFGMHPSQSVTHWGCDGDSGPPCATTTQPVRPSEAGDRAMADVPIADYDWVYTVKGGRLHHPRLTSEQHAECEEWGGVYDEPVTLDCGRIATTVLIPGVLSRMGTQRCSRCCRATGLPNGKGSPKNDDRCRKILGMD